MCNKNCTNKCKRERCKTLGTLARLHTEPQSEKPGLGTWAYNAGFIAQLVSQKQDTLSIARANRKAPSKALKVYTETQKVIESNLSQPLVRTA